MKAIVFNIGSKFTSANVMVFVVEKVLKISTGSMFENFFVYENSRTCGWE